MKINYLQNFINEDFDDIDNDIDELDDDIHNELRTHLGENMKDSILDFICNVYRIMDQRAKDISRSELAMSIVITPTDKGDKFPFKISFIDAMGMFCTYRFLVKPENKNILHLTNDFFRFGTIYDFDCNGCHGLETLEGAPDRSLHYFSCANCTKLKNLIGGPLYADMYQAHRCESLESLIGSPIRVTDFYIDYCYSLTSLEGAPKEVIGQFNMNCCENVTNFVGCPKEVGTIRYELCYSIISTEGFPKVKNKSVPSDPNSVARVNRRRLDRLTSYLEYKEKQ